jgi:ParB-like chromosome segregation protein Spo0J
VNEYKSIPVADLIPYANNSRTHDDVQIAQIAASIKEFGFTNPVLVDPDNGIIAGHGRILAAQKLGIDKVPTILIDQLSEAQKKAYILADNKLALNAGWDDELLSIELADLKDMEFDLSVIGFDDDELMTLMDDPDFDAGDELDQGKLDQLSPVYVTCPSCGKEFDSREQS